MDNPNTEKLVIAWLQTLDEITGDWPVYGDKPATLPDQYILVDRTGGPREAMVLDRAAILIEVYHKNSRVTASDMANYIADQIPAGLPAYAESITGASVNSVVNLDDLIAQYSRYQVYADVNNRR
jgi:hypothetical protein